MIDYHILKDRNVYKCSVHVILMFIRANRRKNKVYYYVVESERVGKKVKQRVLLYLGSAKTIFNKLKKNS